MSNRTPMKRTAWNRVAKSQRNELPDQEEQAPVAIKKVATFTRRGVIASVNDAVFAQPKEDVARSEKYRRRVALLPCCHCGIEGYSQAAHGDQGKGLGIKADDRTCYPACAPHDGRQGCHYLIGTSGTYTREERRALDAQYGAQTRTKILDLGLWPANLPLWQETETPMFDCAADPDKSSTYLDDEQDDAPVIRVMVSAVGLGIPGPAIASPNSIFDLAEKPVKVKINKNEEPTSACYAHLSVASGVTTVAGASYPARWTEADHEREAERRQRQRPPRPTRAAKTKSAKLRDLIGDDDE